MDQLLLPLTIRLIQPVGNDSDVAAWYRFASDVTTSNL